eukprot:5904323-Prorocentrum_lima.AAC.1
MKPAPSCALAECLEELSGGGFSVFNLSPGVQQNIRLAEMATRLETGFRVECAGGERWGCQGVGGCWHW